MAKMVRVNFRNIETKEFLEGTSLLEISKYFSKYFNYPILIARVDNNLKSLNEFLFIIVKYFYNDKAFL